MKKRTISLALFIFLLASGPAAAITEYKVEKGDTLWKIGVKFNKDLNDIINSNPHIKNPDFIYPRQIVLIPGQTGRSGTPKIAADERTIWELANDERKQKGLKPLVMDSMLTGVAKQKSQDMMKFEYVSHNSPTYGNPTKMLRNQQISFLTVKENIGAGYRSADEMFSAWMNSSIHRANILDKKATHIGVGYVKGGLHGHYWTIFIVEKNEGG
ncbi:LysM peptidoglycan-binding domain-containing protein [Bacillus sp. ISL-47]|uniref:CAP domain-containing protein n=1 Tax=Bacillus sp. ISL-47 TaxID=2819130 RepID=UPI001BE7F9E5|nr:CAP domain-containing protein [Bacillus sp. ISL-47]MBT2687899.1 LysM peptidoglycan-binding domain-containing protein [Bacillus sp. ISL-47]MBT2708024.1 LysM peptidoglycan-binding domain-containing protein [Pseudomonas sp. ISL-84]